MERKKGEKMYSNHWGGPLEINDSIHGEEEERSRINSNNNNNDWDRSSIYHQQNFNNNLDETQQSWLLDPSEKKKKTKYIDFGCIVCSTKALKWTVYTVLIAFLVIGLPVMIVNLVPKHKPRPPIPDNYTVALHKALLFFNAQKCTSSNSSSSLSYLFIYLLGFLSF